MHRFSFFRVFARIGTLLHRNSYILLSPVFLNKSQNSDDSILAIQLSPNSIKPPPKRRKINLIDLFNNLDLVYLLVYLKNALLLFVCFLNY